MIKIKKKRIRARNREWGLLSFLHEFKPIPKNCQETIRYKRMFQDGICHVEGKYYTKMIQYFDINYKLAETEDKELHRGRYQEFLNYFEDKVHIQFYFMNQKSNLKDIFKMIAIPWQDDGLNDIRGEYEEMLKGLVEKGNNGIVKNKYLVFGIEADSLEKAKSRLGRIEMDILNSYKKMRVAARPVSGKERLEVLYKALHTDTVDDFQFNYNLVKNTGKSTKDFIAPTAIDLRKPQFIGIGKAQCAVSYVEFVSARITDRFLSELLRLNDNLQVSLHIEPMEQKYAIKMVKRAISDLQKMKIDEQKKAVRSGYDMDILPADINLFGYDAEQLSYDLQNDDEKLFKITMVFMHSEQDIQRLEDTISQTKGLIEARNCHLRRLNFLQEKGLNTILPIGLNLLNINRIIPTLPLATMTPFVVQEVFHEGDALYYGCNAISGNLIMIDRKQLRNSNGLIFGVPGSGKSFAAKREIIGVYLTTPDDILILDPESEYGLMVKALGGQVIPVSSCSGYYINPMDLNANYGVDEAPIKAKAEFLLVLLESMLKGVRGYEEGEKSIIDGCIPAVYAKYLNDPRPENMPILEDLYEELGKLNNPIAQRLVTNFQIYITGSHNVFNHRTNVDIHNRLICFDTKQLGSSLKAIGMMIIQDQIWNRVSENRNKKKYTRYYVDEFHILLSKPQTVEYSVEIWKRFRKWGGIPTGITQNIKDMLKSPEIQNIFENSAFIYMLSQGSDDKQILARALHISPEQLSYVEGEVPGNGLICIENVILPSRDQHPINKCYSLMTTKMEEV